MKRIILAIIAGAIIVVDMVTGRSITNGIDSIIPRKPIPHSQPQRVEIKITGDKTVSRDIWCEDYYDAQGGSRGNFWSVREKGMTGMMDASREKVSVDGTGIVSFIMPTCVDLSKGDGFEIAQMVLLINGVVYGHKSSQGDSHTFIARHAHEGPDVTLEFTVSVNGRKVK